MYVYSLLLHTPCNAAQLTIIIFIELNLYLKPYLKTYIKKLFKSVKAFSSYGLTKGNKNSFLYI